MAKYVAFIPVLTHYPRTILCSVLTYSVANPMLHLLLTGTEDKFDVKNYHHTFREETHKQK